MAVRAFPGKPPLKVCLHRNCGLFGGLFGSPDPLGQRGDEVSFERKLDAGDVELGRVLHKEGLPKGETYREAGVYTLPIDSAGDFTIFVTADSDFARFEGLRWRHPLSPSK